MSSELRRYRFEIALGFTLVVGVMLRVLPIALSNVEYPLGGGGLYYYISKSIVEANFGYIERIPYYTNGGVPFAYPPLVFYVVATIASLTPVSILSLHTYLPFLVGILTVPAYFYFASEIFEDRKYAVFATLVYALIPSSFSSFLSGDGLIEAVGTLTFIVGAVALLRIDSDQRRKYVLLSGVLFAISILSSPGGAYGFALLLVVIAFVNDRGLFDVRGFASVSLLGGIGGSIWWYNVISRHGYRTLVHAFTSRQGFLGRLAYTLGYANPLVSVFWSTFAFVGGFYCAMKRDFFLPLLFVAFLFAGEIGYLLPVPGAALVTVGVFEVIIPGMERRVPEFSKEEYGFPKEGNESSKHDHGFSKGWEEFSMRWGESSKGWAKILNGGRTFPILFVFLILTHGVGYASLASYKSSNADVSDEMLTALERTAEITPEESSFFVVDPDPETEWWTGDWFPAITQRTAHDVRYGTEWNGEFSKRVRMDSRVNNANSLDELNRIADEYDVEYTHVFVATSQQTEHLIRTLEDSPCTEKIVETDAAVVFNVKGCS